MNMEISTTPLPFEDFSQQVSEVWDSSLAKKQIKTSQASHREDFEKRCYKMYLNAIEGILPFMVVGHEGLCESVEMLYNFGVLSTDEPFCKKEIKGPLPTEMHQGAVLSQSNWSVLLNDSYIFGAIHARKSFHLYEPEGRLPNKNFWDDQNQRPRVLGREVMMLKAAGYIRLEHPYPSLEKVLIPGADRRVGLKELIAAAEKTESLESIRVFIGYSKDPKSPLDPGHYSDVSQKA